LPNTDFLFLFWFLPLLILDPAEWLPYNLIRAGSNTKQALARPLPLSSPILARPAILARPSREFTQQFWSDQRRNLPNNSGQISNDNSSQTRASSLFSKFWPDHRMEFTQQFLTDRHFEFSQQFCSDHRFQCTQQFCIDHPCEFT
jgi:hypothetical protein